MRVLLSVTGSVCRLGGVCRDGHVELRRPRDSTGGLGARDLTALAPQVAQRKARFSPVFPPFGALFPRFPPLAPCSGGVWVLFPLLGPFWALPKGVLFSFV